MSVPDWKKTRWLSDALRDHLEPGDPKLPWNNQHPSIRFELDVRLQRLLHRQQRTQKQYRKLPPGFEESEDSEETEDTEEISDPLTPPPEPRKIEYGPETTTIRFWTEEDEEESDTQELSQAAAGKLSISERQSIALYLEQ
jgi:hypothetical protein